MAVILFTAVDPIISQMAASQVNGLRCAGHPILFTVHRNIRPVRDQRGQIDPPTGEVHHCGTEARRTGGRQFQFRSAHISQLLVQSLANGRQFLIAAEGHALFTTGTLQQQRVRLDC